MKKALKIFGIVIGCILVVAIGYVLYVFLSYSRIEDNLPLSVEGSAQESVLPADGTYTVVVNNLGFGAYTADYTFFMDGGKESRARSRESTIDCITQGGNKALSYDPDFVLFQEVDTDSDRSYHVNQAELLRGMFPGYCSVEAVNYHSAYLMYPVTRPHGASNSSILTLSRYAATSALRRSLPISDSLSKILDLDRAYSVTRIPLDDGRGFCLYNVHLSAYGVNDDIKTRQVKMLFDDMTAEIAKGNSCLAGGDFNCDFTGTSVLDLNGKPVDFGWAQPFPDELIPDGIRKVTPDNPDVATCRNNDKPYEDGDFVIIVDGFFASEDLVIESCEDIWTGFVYSDHNPVVCTFSFGR